jgi:peptidoglycan/LPS O-acetylase OafA/YrhL
MKVQIDTLRGFACLLLVGYHVVGADPGHGLRVADGALRWINDALAYLRMPLFTFLSGLVYGLRPFGGNSQAFLLGKARRLLVPMLVVGTLFALLQAITPGTNSSVGAWYLLHIQPVAHFWFVESLFWVFLGIWALERWKLIETSKGFILTLALSCALYLSVRGWPWFGIEGAIYLMPYFLVGLACSRFAILPPISNVWVKLGLTAIAIGAAMSMGMPTPNPDRRTLAMLLVGVALCLLSIGSKMTAPWLARIGHHSYAIYLWHVFFTAPARMALDLLEVDYIVLDLVLGIVCGLAGPMLMEGIFSGLRWPALLLLGKSVKKKNGFKPNSDVLSMAR